MKKRHKKSFSCSTMKEEEELTKHKNTDQVDNTIGWNK